jgi:hypothetical protein
MCVVAVLIGDKGDSGAPFDFIEGGGTTSGAQSSLKASAEGGGSSRACWSGARRSGVKKKSKGRREGPAASQAVGDERLRHVERGNLGAWAAARGVRGGSDKTHGRWARAMAGERHRTRRGAGR